MELSKRLLAAAELVTKGSVTADVGCDHGYAAIYLVDRRVSPRVIAMDVNKGPLMRAEEHIRKYGFCAYIETRLSDGLAELEPGEADALLISGMGGRLIIRILQEGLSKVKAMREIILQPQSDMPGVRRYLREEGFSIAEERIVFEDGNYYSMLRAVPIDREDTGEAPALLADQWGGYLLERRNPLLREYILYKRKEYLEIRKQLERSWSGNDRQRNRLTEVEELLKLAEEALSFYE